MARVDNRAIMAPSGEDGADRERRREKRHVALLRVALLHAQGTKDLCVVKNVSSTGLSIRAYRKFVGGEHVEVEFRSGELLNGSVVWQQDWDAGIVFPKPIDVDLVLASRWVTESGRRRNLPRIEVSCPGRLKSGLRFHEVALQDISQGGARVKFETPSVDAGNVVLHLPDLTPLAGVARWVGGAFVGISFNECIPFELLARWIHVHRQ